MIRNGWQISGLYNSSIGLRVRIFYSGEYFSDGVINAWLSGSLNGGKALWHILVDNGMIIEI